MTAYRGVPLAHERLPEDEAVARSREFLASIETRRSVRHFSRAPVPWELVENAVRAAGSARRAPTSSRGRSRSSPTPT